MRILMAASLVGLLGGCASVLGVGDKDNGQDGGAPSDMAHKVTPPPGDMAGAPAPADLANAPPLAPDDAKILISTLPGIMDCAGTFNAQVKVHNTGSATWTRAAGYKLGGVGDKDSFHPGEARIWLPDNVSVAPGDDYEFTIPMVAPAQAGDYLTQWQMVHEGIRWFGEITSQTVTVACAAPFDFAHTTVLNSPADIGTWPETAKITQLDLQASGVFIDFTKKDGMGSWPDVPFGMPGDSLEYTLWIVIHVNTNWYASGCIEYWRGLARNGGPPSQYAMNWYYDANRWGAMTGHQPVAGEQVGFFVSAGDARNNGDAIVKERSNVVFVPFPTDQGAVFNY